jgi:hypothetical protein
VGTAVVSAAAPARAEQTVIVTPGNAPRSRAETSAYAGPNRALLTTGLITFGIPYISSAIIAAESSHPGDSHLWVPVVGPWLDLGSRGPCPAAWSACDSETANRVILVVDGILQGAGALQLIGAFVFPEHTVRVAATAFTPEFTLTPARVARDGYGLAAIGRF